MPAPLETGRAPETTTLEVPQPEPVPTVPVAEPVFPPRREVFLPPGSYLPLPPVLIIPPPGQPPPCPPDNPDCKPPPPPPPPDDVPEPATLFILLAGALALWLGLRGLPVPARVRRKT